MFDEFYKSFRNIISNIAIIGYSESDIIKRGSNIKENLELTCLYCYPVIDEKSYNSITYDMMFPNGNHNIECPKFFPLTLTDEKGMHSFLYCLKFPEKYQLLIDTNNNNNITEITVPIIICIKSEKSDLEPFRQLLTSINQLIITENYDYDAKIVNNYKKVELMNILYFIFSLPHTAPHSLVRLKLNNYIFGLEEDIDFYFSSNCEIPCNKIDTDINLLFLILDQSIIIKVILDILSEKPMVFRSSQPYILNLIIPTFLKLIFPFKWFQPCLIILSKENIGLLDIPGLSIIGILSSLIKIQEIMDEYPGKLIIDCDTNEIFGEKSSTPFIPPMDITNEENNGGKKKNKDKGIYSKIKQGKNTFFIDKSYLYEYDPEIKGKGKKFQFVEKNDITIDTQNSQILINKKNDVITSDELKWLRKNIQLVRNPEIFDIGNIYQKKEDLDEKKHFNENESVILPNRPFSYNIQNILMNFYLNKLSDEKSEFMENFKTTYLFSFYSEYKKYQNDSSQKIVENIKETINEQRSIDNCFMVEYNNKTFPALNIIEILDKKISKMKSDILRFDSNISINNDDLINDNKNNDKYNIYNKIKNILMDYCLVSGINLEQMKNEISINDDNKLQKISFNSLNKSKNKHNKSTHYKGHIKSNKNLLQYSSNQNPNFVLAGIDKYSKNYFKFYGINGFLNFLNNIEDFIKEEGKDIDNIVFRDRIYNQLINIFKNFDNIFNYSNEENNEIKNVDIDVLDKEFNEMEENEGFNLNLDINALSKVSIKSQNDENNNDTQNIIDELRNINSIRKTNNSAMSMIEENDEEYNESYIEKTATRKFLNKLGNNMLNNMTFKNDENADENNNEEIIIVFPDIENEKEIEIENKDLFNQIHFNNNNINDIKIGQKKNMKCLTQYYLYLAFYLEEIEYDDLYLDKFNKDISKSIGTQISIYKYILKLYKEAYINSGEKHRDFPYFSFYSYLINLDYETLSKMENNLNEENGTFSELYEIYLNILSKKIVKVEKKTIFNNFDKRNSLDKFRGISINNTGNPLFPIEKESYLNISYRPDSCNPNNILNKRLSASGLTLNNLKQSYSDAFMYEKNCSKAYIINNSPLFTSICKPHSTNIINQFCSALTKYISLEKDIKNKNIEQIFNKLYIKVNRQPFRELLGELKQVKLKSLTSQKEKLCFWLNCFNYLSIYSIFYLKLNFSKIEIWKNFFHNIKYNIGGQDFSLVDMIYIIFKKNIFFENENYIINEKIEKNMIDLSKDKDNEEIKITPFLLYLPTGQFLKPVIYDKFNLESEIKKRIRNYLLNFIKWDADNEILTVNQLILISEHSNLLKYKPYLKDDIYKIIKFKKYQRLASITMKWNLCFDNLFEETNIES